MGRLLACLFALVLAAPAIAGERPVYRPSADAIALLMQDDRATFALPASLAPLFEEDRVFYASPVPSPMLAAPELRAFRVRDPAAAVLPAMSQRLDLAGFDTLDFPTPGYVPTARGARTLGAMPEPGFLLTFEATGPLGLTQIPVRNEVTSSDGGRFAVRETIRRGRRIYRPRAFDAMVQLRLDGRDDTPSLDVTGGVAAAIWDAIPR